MKYTPRPWKFKYHMNIDGVGIMEAEFDVTVKDLNIIAAAPDMKDLLRQAADELHAIGCGKAPADGLELSERITEFLMTLDGEEPPMINTTHSHACESQSQPCDIKPCPFCGGEAEVEDCRYGYYVICQSPTCLVSPETGDYETKAAAIAAWNMRAGDD